MKSTSVRVGGESLLTNPINDHIEKTPFERKKSTTAYRTAILFNLFFVSWLIPRLPFREYRTTMIVVTIVITAVTSWLITNLVSMFFSLYERRVSEKADALYHSPAESYQGLFADDPPERTGRS
jgi:hypothetical protein